MTHLFRVGRAVVVGYPSQAGQAGQIGRVGLARRVLLALGVRFANVVGHAGHSAHAGHTRHTRHTVQAVQASHTGQLRSPSVASVIAITIAITFAPPGISQAWGQTTGRDSQSAVPESRDRIARSLKSLERAARNYPRHRDCFACHHQTFPLLVQVEGRRLGIESDEPTRLGVAKFTRDWFSRRERDLRAGQAIDGRAITVAYGLWTLELAEVDDPVVDAMADYLLKVQRADGAWEPEALRPPAEESKAFVTALALRGLRWSADRDRPIIVPRQSFQKDAGRDPRRNSQPDPRQNSQPLGERDAALVRAADRGFAWLATHATAAIEGESIDDMAGQLLAYVWRPDRFPPARAAVRGERIHEWQGRLTRLQRSDGGWGQRRGMESDPYATGLALWTLAESGVERKSPALQRGAEFLRSRQAADGSWHTRSRCEPFQPYFDNGDPYGRDQFLSLMATGWSAAALARLSP